MIPPDTPEAAALRKALVALFERLEHATEAERARVLAEVRAALREATTPT